MENLKEFAEQIANLTVLEAHKLSEIMKDEYGIEPASQEIIATEVAEVQVEEQTEFDVILTSFGTKKLQIVRELKNITGKSLKESKDFTDNIPSVIQEGVSRSDAEITKSQLENAGAEVEIK